MGKIIGFLGHKGAGKDTAGEYLIERYKYKRYAFADPVKEIARNMFDLSEDQLHGDKKEVIDIRWNLRPRTIFQRLGTELGQYDIHKLFPEMKGKVKTRRFWTYLFEQWLENNKNENIVITDVRFKHEIEVIKKYGGQIIKISNPNIKKHDNHISELELNQLEFDSEIINDTELVDLYSQLDIIALVPF